MKRSGALPCLLAETLDTHAGAAFPGEAERIVERMQHREGKMHAGDRHARRRQSSQKPRTIVSRSSPASDEWVSQSATLSIRIVEISGDTAFVIRFPSGYRFGSKRKLRPAGVERKTILKSI